MYVKIVKSKSQMLSEVLNNAIRIWTVSFFFFYWYCLLFKFSCPYDIYLQSFNTLDAETFSSRNFANFVNVGQVSRPLWLEKFWLSPFAKVWTYEIFLNFFFYFFPILLSLFPRRFHPENWVWFCGRFIKYESHQGHIKVNSGKAI